MSYRDNEILWQIIPDLIAEGNSACKNLSVSLQSCNIMTDRVEVKNDSFSLSPTHEET